MTAGSIAKRDDQALAGFIERFASTLTESGFPRMLARLFAARSLRHSSGADGEPRG